MRLLLVELTRFRSRRAIVLMLLAATLLTAFLAVSTIYETRPVSAADRAAAQAQADAEAGAPRTQRVLARCENNPERFLGDNADPAQCAEQILPQPEWYLYRSELNLAEERGDSGLAALFIVAALMIIVGTTFAGADWASGSVSNQVLFEPRRMKVWLTKALAVFLAAAAVSAVILAGFWLALFVTAEIRDIETGATLQADIRSMAARGALLGAFGAVGGYALTMLVRHTVGTLAVLFAYAVGGEALTAALPIEGVGQWALSNNVFAWLRDGYTYYDGSLPCRPGRGGCDQMAAATLADGATYLGLTLLVVAVLSLLLFRRRDIP